MIKDIYNNARTAENKRNNDWFKQYFAPPAQVPVRPCKVDQPIRVSASKLTTTGTIKQESALAEVKEWMAPFVIPIISWGDGGTTTGAPGSLLGTDTIAKLSLASTGDTPSGSTANTLRGKKWDEFERGQLLNSGIDGNWHQSGWLQASSNTDASL